MGLKLFFSGKNPNMKSKFYQDLKKNFDSENLDTSVYSSLLDKHIDTLKCQGKDCMRLFGIKKSLEYIFLKYKNLSDLKKQNEEIFSQILHDIKSPMLGIKYALENSKRSELDDEIYKINTNILDMIKDFLLLYSFKDGFTCLSFEEFCPYELVRREVELYTPLFRSKNIKTLIKKDNDTLLCSNKSVFSRIVSNLLSNAIKYSPKDTQIEIKIKNKGNNIVVSVKNHTCVDFDDKDEKIFDKFNTKGAENSFGLGLFISKRLAKRINSTLRVKKTSKSVIFELIMPKIDPQCR